MPIPPPTSLHPILRLRRRVSGACHSRHLRRRVLSYGPLPHQQMLVWHPRHLPPTSGWPGLILLHGGGYREGSPADFSSLGPRFARRGLWVAAPVYGLGPRHPYPQALQDTLQLLHFLASEAMGQHRLTPNNIGLLGYSAGAHLALMTALEAPSPPAAVAAHSAPTRLAAEDQASLLPALDGPTRDRHSPALRAPIRQLPILLVHGTADDIVSFRHAQILAAHNPQVELLAVEGGDHALRHPFWGAERARRQAFHWMCAQLGV